MQKEIKSLARLVSVLTMATLLLFLGNLVLFVRLLDAQNATNAILESYSGGYLENFIGYEIGDRVPELDTITIDGERVHQDNLEGDPIVFVFANTACSACVDMFPHLRAVEESFQNAEFVLFINGSQEEIETIRDELGFNFPIVFNSSEAYESYRVPGTPYFLVLGADGEVRNSGFAKDKAGIAHLISGGT